MPFHAATAIPRLNMRAELRTSRTLRRFGQIAASGFDKIGVSQRLG
nr:hypothetical protein [Sphingomonas sp. Leaf357]